MDNSQRFQVVDKSTSAHCCFGYTVIETSFGSDPVDQSICECFEKRWAELIRDALNEMASKIPEGKP